MIKNNCKSIILGVILGILLITQVAIIVLALINKTSEDIFYDNINKTVEIRCSNDGETWGYATGCFIDSDGTILTNRHVILSDGIEQIYNHVEVRLAISNDWQIAEIIKKSKESDLAIIKVNLNDNEYFKLGKAVINGESIYTIGNPNGYGLSFLEGVVSSELRNVNTYGRSYKMLQTSFVINGGNSGGPVFNKRGKLVGLISFRSRDSLGETIQGVSFAVPISDIRNFVS